MVRGINASEDVVTDGVRKPENEELGRSDFVKFGGSRQDLT
jgi:hypothetical protein